MERTNSVSDALDCRHETLHRAESETGSQGVHRGQRSAGTDVIIDGLVLSAAQQIRALALVERVTRCAPFRYEC
jgi:hypothetical protein